MWIFMSASPAIVLPRAGCKFDSIIISQQSQVEMQSFERIACDMGYVYNYACSLHGEALKEFEEKVLNFS